MPIGSFLPIATGLLGAIAGGQRDQSSQTTSINLAPESEFERQGRQAQQNQFQDLLKLLGGQSTEQIQGFQTSATQAQTGLDQLLSAFAQAGGRPTQAQLGEAQTYAGQVFAPQQVAMQQAFQDQTTAANQAAARMGRSFGNDPILRARLAQEQTRQQAQLQAQQGSYAAQYAQQIPQQAIGAQEALLNLRQGIASQAMQNRLNLLNLGNQIQQQERDFRLRSAGQTTTGESGGGFKGALTGALGGATAGMNLAQQWGQFSQMGGATAQVANAGKSPWWTGAQGAAQSKAMSSPAQSSFSSSFDTGPAYSAGQYLPPTRAESFANWATAPAASSPKQFMNWLNGPNYADPNIGWGRR